MNYPYILILHEKWGDTFFVMTCDKDVFKFALDTFNYRFGAGYFVEPEPVPKTFGEFFMQVHNMSDDEAQVLSEKYENIRIGNRLAKDEILSMKEAYKLRCAEVADYKKIATAYKTQDARVAWEIISRRNTEYYEYETFDTKQIENQKTTEGTN